MTMTSTMIKELKTDGEIESSFNIMKQLRTHLNLQSYVKLVAAARKENQYRIFALYKKEEMLALVGFMPMITLYYGEYIWVCDLVTDDNNRSNGYGNVLLSYVHQWAKENHYHTVALSSGLARTDAHRFYEEKMGYDKVSFVLKKDME
jgi:GNAT superfamily N-acetyltransferase